MIAASSGQQIAQVAASAGVCRELVDGAFEAVSPRQLASTYSAIVCFWHIADIPTAPEFVRFWSNSGQKAALGLDLSAAIDPKRTLSVHCSTRSLPLTYINFSHSE